jgi:hypothetical protein
MDGAHLANQYSRANGCAANVLTISVGFPSPSIRSEHATSTPSEQKCAQYTQGNCNEG